MKVRNVILLGGLLALSAVAAGPAAAPAAPAAPVSEDQLTVITSDKLTFDYQKHFALFETNVVVTDPQIKILSDKLTVIFDDKNAAQSVKAEGHVFLLQLDKKAKADLCIYDVATGEIQLIGNPQVTSGQDLLTGDKITFWRNENRMKVENRAKLILTPGPGNKSPLSGAGLL